MENLNRENSRQSNIKPDTLNRTTSFDEVPSINLNNRLIRLLPKDMEFSDVSDDMRAQLNDEYQNIIKCINPDGSMNLVSQKVIFNSAIKSQNLNFLKKNDINTLKFSNIIEIYDLSTFAQVYRNPTFFTFSSYSPFELITNGLDDLFDRNEEVNASVFELFSIAKTLTGGEPITNVPPHLIKEAKGNKRKVFNYTPDIAVPMKQGNSDEVSHILLSGKVEEFAMDSLIK